jgi:hypothetical protein
MEKAKKILAAVLLALFLAPLAGCVVVDKNAVKEFRHYAHWPQHHHRR